MLQRPVDPAVADDAEFQALAAKLSALQADPVANADAIGLKASEAQGRMSSMNRWRPSMGFGFAQDPVSLLLDARCSRLMALGHAEIRNKVERMRQLSCRRQQEFLTLEREAHNAWETEARVLAKSGIAFPQFRFGAFWLWSPFDVEWYDIPLIRLGCSSEGVPSAVLIESYETHVRNVCESLIPSCEASIPKQLLEMLDHDERLLLALFPWLANTSASYCALLDADSLWSRDTLDGRHARLQFWMLSAWSSILRRAAARNRFYCSLKREPFLDEVLLLGGLPHCGVPRDSREEAIEDVHIKLRRDILSTIHDSKDVWWISGIAAEDRRLEILGLVEAETTCMELPFVPPTLNGVPLHVICPSSNPALSAMIFAWNKLQTQPSRTSKALLQSAKDLELSIVAAVTELAQNETRMEAGVTDFLPVPVNRMRYRFPTWYPVIDLALLQTDGKDTIVLFDLPSKRWRSHDSHSLSDALLRLVSVVTFAMEEHAQHWMRHGSLSSTPPPRLARRLLRNVAAGFTVRFQIGRQRSARIKQERHSQRQAQEEAAALSARKRATIALQRFGRGYAARKAMQTIRLRCAAMALNRWCNGYSVRKRVAARRIKVLRAKNILRKITEGYKARWQLQKVRLATFLLRRIAAALSVRLSLARRHRIRVAEHHRRRSIEAAVRAKQATELHATRKLQAVGRGFMCRLSLCDELIVKQRRRRLELAGALLRRVWRGYQVRHSLVKDMILRRRTMREATKQRAMLLIRRVVVAFAIRKRLYQRRHNRMLQNRRAALAQLMSLEAQKRAEIVAHEKAQARALLQAHLSVKDHVRQSMDARKKYDFDQTMIAKKLRDVEADEARQRNKRVDEESAAHRAIEQAMRQASRSIVARAPLKPVPPRRGTESASPDRGNHDDPVISTYRGFPLDAMGRFLFQYERELRHMKRNLENRRQNLELDHDKVRDARDQAASEISLGGGGLPLLQAQAGPTAWIPSRPLPLKDLVKDGPTAVKQYLTKAHQQQLQRAASQQRSSTASDVSSHHDVSPPPTVASSGRRYRDQ